MKRADILLLNTSNYPGLPIYPYAFVQVSAIARQHGLSVRRLDLLGVDPSEWPGVLAAELARTEPRMIGIHLRQADSLYIWDYVEPGAPGMPASSSRNYFPVVDTQRLISVLRSLTGVPIVLGGFGFTTHARSLVQRLEPDFAILGEADDFFRRIDSALAGKNLDEIDNLIYRKRDDYVFGRRVYYGPPAFPEYTEDVLDDLVAFYGRSTIDAPDGPHVPVELMRGCPYRCYFCTEPAVKGKQQRIRNLDVVMADVRFLGERGVPRVWMICSEANVGSNRALFDTAERMREFNRGRPEPMSWSAYFLPNPPMTRAEIRFLLESGFAPGWNQFMSFDNDNLKRTKVPYRARHALDAQVAWADERRLFQQRQGVPTRGHRLDMFLGNSFADAATITNTVATLDSADLAELHDSALITRATRVFDLGNGPIGDPDSMFSIGPGGRLSTPDLVYPTFHYPPDLVRRLGGTEAVDEFFAYLESTFFSRAHRIGKDWRRFLRESVPAGTFAGWCRADRDGLAELHLVDDGEGYADEVRRWAEVACDEAGVVEELFSHRAIEGFQANLVAYVLTELVLLRGTARLRSVLEHLDLPPNVDESAKWTEYQLLKHLFARYRSERELMDGITRNFGVTEDSRTAFALKYFLFSHDLRLRPEYRDLLCHGLPLPNEQEPLTG